MNRFKPRHDGQTRKGFRILSGFVAAFILLVSLPLAIYEAACNGGGWNWESWWNWFVVLGCVYAGVGMAVGAKTGRWFNSPG